MNHLALRSSFLLLAAAALLPFARAEEKVPLKLQLPKPMFVGTPVPVKLPNLETPRASGRRPDFMVPKGVVNLALNKTVTSSDMEPVLGDLAQITDGEKAGDEGNYVEFGKGKQWVQVDLGAASPIYAIVVWHYHSQARVYKAVVAQLSDDPDFIKDVVTVYNNDDRNVNGLGEGKDPTYIETNEGRIIDAKGTKARYVRLYSNGNTTSDMNHYIEVEVWGLPAQ
ncbi:hypothetical protein DB347_09975 [Opitutaceae bacterium EW11]|nr:hypothetical protein DB347_09975 [Opitutaceae bacterium EW11]